MAQRLAGAGCPVWRRPPRSESIPRRIAALGLCVMLLTVGLGPEMLRAASAPNLSGTFQFIAEQSDDIDQAISEAIDTMNVVVRPFARRRLQHITAPYPLLRIRATPDAMLMVADTRAPIHMLVNGTAVRWKREDGEMFNVSGMWDGDAFEQTFVSGTGRRVNRYVLSSDGQMLTIQVVVTGGGLPGAMRYHLAYRRMS